MGVLFFDRDPADGDDFGDNMGRMKDLVDGLG